MVDPKTMRRWLYRGLYLILSMTAISLYILPLSVGTGRIPGPDLLVAISFAWVMRRPAYVPVWLVAVVMLLADFIFMRPPGLWAALTLIGLEFLRRREQTSRDMTFMVEWSMVAGVVIGMAVFYQLTLVVFMVERASLGLLLLQQVTTLVAYPVVVFASKRVFGITKMTASEADDLKVAR